MRASYVFRLCTKSANPSSCDNRGFFVSKYYDILYRTYLLHSNIHETEKVVKTEPIGNIYSLETKRHN